ncbi:MAG: hypothetical protein IJG08_07180, partial [Oscillospiraceae bacterium]|nr:hypothetical protein [Oscillospiraceae bacterium]
MKLRNLTAFCLALVLVLSLLAGCAKEPAATEPAATVPASAPANTLAPTTAAPTAEPSAETEPAPQTEPAAPADMGTKVLELKKDEDNMFPVTVEAIAAQMSGVRSLSFEAVPDLGESPEPYLLNSYQMAALVTDTEIVPGDERLHPNDER